MADKFCLYVADTETTSLDMRGDIIELSLYRIEDSQQKTWYFKAINEEFIEASALAINKHKLEDITWKTKAGKEKYKLPEEVLPDIENWIADGDRVTSNDRILSGWNISFDELRMKELWKRCKTEETYPFSRNTVDLKGLAIFLDYIYDIKEDTYSLFNVIKRLGLFHRNAHKAEEDVLMTVDILKYYRDKLKNERPEMMVKSGKKK